MKLLDLTGKTFGRLQALTPTMARGYHGWRCLCTCGNYTDVVTNDLTGGNTKSCGCLKRDRPAQVHRTHGHEVGGRMTPTYMAWLNMRARCLNPTRDDFKNYGGRGISVCKRWMKFENFLADMGVKPAPHLSLERKNNNGHYEPTNSKWATRSEQNSNQRRRGSTPRVVLRPQYAAELRV